MNTVYNKKMGKEIVFGIKIVMEVFSGNAEKNNIYLVKKIEIRD